MMNVPLRNAAYACSISASVFITIGPYQATGSSIAGNQQEPYFFLACLHRHLVAAVEQDKRPVPCSLADRRSASVSDSFGQDPEWPRRGAKRSGALNT
jgi:hypothetical protein